MEIIIMNGRCLICGASDPDTLIAFIDAENSTITVRCKNNVLCHERYRDAARA